MEFTDKSATHVKVSKNGHEGWILKHIWAEMVEQKDLNGFVAIVEAPVEVEELKLKKRLNNPEESTLEEVTEEKIVKRRSKKDENQE